MQVMSSYPPFSPPPNDFSGKFARDFGVKLQLGAEEPNEPSEKREEEPNNQPEIEHEEEEDDDEEEEEEFSFVCLNPDGSPISADDVFQDGQIRPVFPLFNQDLLFAGDDGSVWAAEGDVDGVSLRPPLRKLFVEDSTETVSSSSSSEPAGPYCEWKRDVRTVEEASPETCKKSNSTGFSKLWRFRDLMHRSSSDGKDAFVFLSHPPPSVRAEKKSEKEEKQQQPIKNEKKEQAKPKAAAKKKEKSNGVKTASLSAHEVYIKNRAIKEGDKRRSYLPLRHVGFFTNVNGLSRNIHPF